MERTLTPNATLISLFRRASQAMVEELVQSISEAGYPGVSGAHHPIFENIDPGGTRLTELARRAGLTHQSMGELVETLERRGYVERVRDPSDARVRLVRLTPRGRRMVSVALREIKRIEREWEIRLRRSGLSGSLGQAVGEALQPKVTHAR